VSQATISQIEMIAIPAVDLRDGRFARQGRRETSAASAALADPSEIARSLADLGFTRIHLVDNPARQMKGSSAPAVEEIVRETNAKVQVAGVNSGSAIEQLFRSGADYVVVGGRAIEEPDWLAGIAELYPDSIVVATDVRDRRIVRRGWVRTVPFDLLDLVDNLSGLPVGGILVDGLQLDAASRHADLALVEAVAERSPCPVMVSARLGTLEDLRAIEHRGAAGAVLSDEQLSRVLDARAVAREFGA